MRDIPPEHRRLIDDVMNWLDFNTVYKAFVATNFGWTKTRPDFSEGVLREWTRKQIEFAYPDSHFSTGGIEVEWTEEDGDKGLIVKFILASWDAWEDEN